jgi:hypothetical protein
MFVMTRRAGYGTSPSSRAERAKADQKIAHFCSWINAEELGKSVKLCSQLRIQAVSILGKTERRKHGDGDVGAHLKT